MCHLIHDTWQLTPDMWHMVEGEQWTLFQNVSFLLRSWPKNLISNGLVFVMFWKSGGKGWLTEWILLVFHWFEKRFKKKIFIVAHNLVKFLVLDVDFLNKLCYS